MIVPNYSGLNPTLYSTKRIIFESGTRCNLQCPGCARTIAKQRGIKFPIMDFSMENFKHLFRPENDLKEVYYSLALSDPIYCGNLFPMMDHLNNLDNRPKVSISTNGSGRKPDWWKKFAQVLHSKDQIEFAVDGLKDTNHIYRINAKFDTIMDGMKTLVDELSSSNKKTLVIWRYIVFEHNHHQVIEAYRKAIQNGCSRFKLILGDNRTPEQMQLKSRNFEDIERELDDEINKNLSKV